MTRFILLLCFSVFTGWLSLTYASAQQVEAQVKNDANSNFWVTRNGKHLELNGKIFRFVSFNIPNLSVVQDYANLVSHYDSGSPGSSKIQYTSAQFRLPSEQEIHSGILTASHLAHGQNTAIRLFVFPIEGGTQDTLSGFAKSCQGDGSAGDSGHPCDAFYLKNNQIVPNNSFLKNGLDKVLQAANQHKVHLIIPIINALNDWGGSNSFVSWILG
ncbi:hypothetical protein [Dongshaea marina]|uniref:hypothetical protein n=1 Tax=Dongshaea marina TaxID=2047966 RepID=UPI000D3ED1BF|nr:hypothetical protein [Dongshaea marina]